MVTESNILRMEIDTSVNISSVSRPEVVFIYGKMVKNIKDILLMA
jgi:hypothetical protein